MNFELPGEYEALRVSVQQLAKEHIKPRAQEVDRNETYPDDWFQLFVDNGLMGLVIPEEYGGSGAGILGLVVAIEEVAKYSNTAALMLLLTRLAAGPVLIAGTEDQKQKYVRAVATGEARASFCLSEPQAGSDVMGIRTHAVADGSNWVISGTKCWISGAEQANWYVVFAKTGEVESRDHHSVTGFIVERDWPGVSIGHVDEKLGVKGVATTEVLLDSVKVPAENVIGEVGGFQLAMQGLNSMRPVVAARGLGVAESALMYVSEYLKSRKAFNKTLADMQGLQWKVAECAAKIEAARLLTYRAASLADEGKFTKEYIGHLSMSKYFATEMAVEVVNECLQMMGAAGYMKDHPIEMYYRDVRQLTIVEGTSQVQLRLIADAVFDHNLWWGDW